MPTPRPRIGCCSPPAPRRRPSGWPPSSNRSAASPGTPRVRANFRTPKPSRNGTPMDGVPGLSFNGIAPGETYIYRFPVHQSGTYWYHSHSGFQEQTGVYGPIVIDPRGGYAQPFDRDYVVFLSDWSDENPDTI